MRTLMPNSGRSPERKETWNARLVSVGSWLANIDWRRRCGVYTQLAHALTPLSAGTDQIVHPSRLPS